MLCSPLLDCLDAQQRRSHEALTAIVRKPWHTTCEDSLAGSSFPDGGEDSSWLCNGVCRHRCVASFDAVCRLGRHGTKQSLAATESSFGVREQGCDAHSALVDFNCNRSAKLSTKACATSGSEPDKEPLETALRSTYMGVSAHGFGGTQVHVISYGHNEQIRTQHWIV